MNKLFDGKEGYLEFHNYLHEEKKLRRLILEE